MEVGFIQIVVLAIIIIGGTAGIIYLIKKPDYSVWEPTEEPKSEEQEESPKEENRHIRDLKNAGKEFAGHFIAQLLFIPFAIIFVLVGFWIISWLQNK